MTHATEGKFGLAARTANITRWSCRGCLLLSATMLLTPAPAQAAKFTLLSAGDLNQFASFGYDYQSSVNAYQAGNSTSTRHGFRESYGLGFGYAILHPRLLRGRAEFEMVANQDLSDDNTTGSNSSINQRLTYRVDGAVLDKKPNPLFFSLVSSHQTVRPPFSRTYTLDTEGRSVSWTIRNELLPFSLLVSKNTTTTSGQERDTENSTHLVNASFEHRVADNSYTRGRLAMQSNSLTFVDSGIKDDKKQATAELSNALSWHGAGGLGRRLDTRYLYREVKGGNAGTQQSFDTMFDWHIGKALKNTLSYSRTRNEDLVSHNDTSTLTGTLRHQYLNSLTTTVGGALAKGNYSDGSDLNKTLNAGANYTVRLPREGRLALFYSYQYNVQDRNRSAVILESLDTVTPGEIYPQFYDVARPDVDTASIRIFLDANLTVPYTDFSVVFSGNQTRLVLNSDPGVSTLYLSYSYRQSPSVEYGTTAQSTGGDLSFQQRTYVLYWGYAWSDVKLLSGSDPLATLGDSTHFKVGGEANLHPHTLTASYAADKSIYQNADTIEAKWSHTMTGRGATLVTRAEDRYSSYEDDASGSGTGWDNNLLFSTTYGRMFSRTVRGKLTLRYTNLMTDEMNSNKVGADFSLEARYRQTLVTLESSGGWSFSSTGHTRNLSVTLDVRRTF